MAADPYRYFRLEARDLLDQLTRTVLQLEKTNAPQEQIKLLLRLAHTLKGAARIVKQGEIAEQAHAIEDQLAPVRETGAVSAPAIAAIYASLARIEASLPGLDGAPRLEDTAPQMIRADIGEMDAIIDLVGDIATQLSGLRDATHGLDKLHRQATQIFGEPNIQIRSAADEFCAGLKRATRHCGAATDRMDRNLTQLRDTTEQLRLVSVETLLTALERTAQDTGRATGKQTAFIATGGRIRLDAHMLAALQGALVQIIRNAVAHGIEASSARIAAGKQPIGQIAVTVERQARRIVFTCQDDGAGLDLAALRQLAVQRGVAAPTAIDATALLQLLMQGGVSTAATVTEASGRGVGLDVVRSVLERLGGTIAVRSQPGTGTIFTLTVPLSLASIDIITVETGGQIMSLPLDCVRGAMRLSPAQAAAAATSAMIEYQGQALPFAMLAQVLDGACPAARAVAAVIIAGADGLAAIGVDRLGGVAQIVMRPLPDGIPHATPAGALFASASFDADGDPRLMLNPHGLVVMARQADNAAPSPANAPRAPVLVVDDSLTSRMLERGILEAAGYTADTANSAEDALEKLRTHRYALFLVDVEMPGMDGFAFVRHIRADPALRDTPAIMVTSCASTAYRERGLSAGAQGYVVKSTFDQTALLGLIGALIGGPDA